MLKFKKEIRYRIAIEFDGVFQQLDGVPANVARDWLWEQVRLGTVETSLIRIKWVIPQEKEIDYESS